MDRYIIAQNLIQESKIKNCVSIVAIQVISTKNMQNTYKFFDYAVVYISSKWIQLSTLSSSNKVSGHFSK